MHVSTRFSTLAMAAAAALSINASDTPVALWAKAFDSNTSAGDNGSGLALDKAGNVLFLNTLGSKAGAVECYFGDVKIFEGAPYEGTSQNNNFDLTKTDPEGNALWTIYSTTGDFSSGQGNVAACPDGSVVFSAKMRHTEGMLDKAYTFVDASGKSFETGQAGVEKRFYSLLLGKADVNGNILWLREIAVDNGASPDGSKDFTADAAYNKGLAVDADGNIYMGGNHRMTLSFEKADGSALSVPARCVAGWDGDSQKTRGSLFIARFDADGYVEDVLTTSGNEMDAEQVLALSTVDNTLIVQGYATASADVNSTDFAGQTLVTGEAGVHSPFLASLNGKNFELNWLSCTKGTKVQNRYAFQNSAISMVNNTIWLTAQFNGSFEWVNSDNVTVASQTGNMREGMLAKLNLATGQCLAATASRDGFTGTAATAITGYLGVVQNPQKNSNVYVYGYGMNAAVGVYLRNYNAETLVPDPAGTWDIIKGDSNSSPTALAIAYNPNSARIYTTTRSNKGIVPAGFSSSTAAPMYWAVWATAFNMPKSFLTGVENVLSSNNNLWIYAVEGGLEIVSDIDTTVQIFSIDGRLRASANVNAHNSAQVDLPAGLYISCGKKFIVR